MALAISDLLQERARRDRDSVAILAPGRDPLSYGALLEFAGRIAGQLQAAGIGRNDRVAVVLPNGPEMAVSFLAVSCAATCAPLNPAYRAEEFDFYLADLGARAVIVAHGHASPVREAARARGVPVIELSVTGGAPAGTFELDVRPGPAAREFAGPADIALVLHTSGTTSRPKIVPLSHANLVASAGHIRAALALEPSDRCLNVMPLFHIHGLIGATLSTIAAGGSIVCTPGFQAPRFFEWLDEFSPTWYTAVPTMHQAVLARADQNREILARRPLRFLRSSSSALAPQVMAKLEEVFRAPVIESYGMTEAAHQMASNPLPPGRRKPGSVGLPAGPEIAIMDEQGNLLPQGETGEVVIRGPNVTAGYENNPEANAKAFTNGWFRTGDQGYLDKDGYLFLTGRLKEIINRGDELLAYWENQLAGPLPVLDLPADHPRPRRRSYAGARESALLPKALADSLESFSRREGVTLFMTLLAAFYVLLHRYTGAEDIVVGSPLAGRTKPATEALIGPFIYSLALRTDLSGGPGFAELLGRVRETVIGALAHEELPFEVLVEKLNPPRSLTYTPVFQVMFQLRNLPPAGARFPGFEFDEADIDPGTAELDLSLEAELTDEGLRVAAIYSTDLFEAPTIRRMLGHYRTLLEGVLRDAGQPISHLPLLTEAERRQILVAWNDTRAETPRICVHEAFERQVAKTPERTAVIFEGEYISYAEVNRRANQLARHLRQLGVGPETPVAIFLERSPQQIVSLLAVLKAGGFHVPLDTEHPPHRTAFILEDASPAVVITDSASKANLPPVGATMVDLAGAAGRLSRLPSDNLAPAATPRNAAYLIYTSGSTGKAKGVLIEHRSVVDAIVGEERLFHLGCGCRMLYQASFAFDAAVLQILDPLCSGGAVVVARPGGQQDLGYLLDLLARERVTNIDLGPGLLRALLDEPRFAELPALRSVGVGNEAVPAELVREFLQRSKAELWNGYGPTETTIVATYIGGTGLARGYWKRPEETAAAFQPHPLGPDSGERVYKTGDIVRFRPDGALEFLRCGVSARASRSTASNPPP